jgi:segregation and condensation protein B
MTNDTPLPLGTADDAGAVNVLAGAPSAEPSGEAEHAAVVEMDDPADEAVDAAGTAVDPEHVRLIEALLFASLEPLSERMLAQRLPEGVSVKAALRELGRLYEGRGVTLVRAGKTWAFRTAPDLARRLNVEVQVMRKLSRAAVETLAIVAYHQPVTRAEIEEIRGVSLSKGTLDHLFELGWIKPGPRREAPGRPVTWGTTDAFLDHFGLESLKDLPGIEELKAAGLLESGPALNAYRVRADNMGPDAMLEDTAPVPGDEALPEPLDPDADEPSPAALRTPSSDAAE